MKKILVVINGLILSCVLLVRCGGGNPVNDKIVPLNSLQKGVVRDFTKNVGSIFRAVEGYQQARFGIDLFKLDDDEFRRENALAKLIWDAKCEVKMEHPADKAAESMDGPLLLIQMRPKNFKLTISGSQCPADLFLMSKIALKKNQVEARLEAKFKAKTEEFKDAYGVESFDFTGSGTIDAEGSLTYGKYKGSASGMGSINTTHWGKVDLGVSGSGEATKSKSDGTFGEWTSKVAFRFPDFTAIYEEKAPYNGGDFPKFKVTENGAEIDVSQYEDKILEELGGDLNSWLAFQDYGIN